MQIGKDVQFLHHQASVASKSAEIHIMVIYVKVKMVVLNILLGVNLYPVKDLVVSIKMLNVKIHVHQDTSLQRINYPLQLTALKT